MHQNKDQQIKMLKNSIEDLKKRNRKLQSELESTKSTNKNIKTTYQAMKNETNESIKLVWEPQVMKKMKELEALLKSTRGKIDYGYK